MSLSYAESLSYFPHKGKVGMPELSESSDALPVKLNQLEQLIRQSHHTVVITGAGISTDAGIPDFRGPNGVWTLEKRGEKPSCNTSFDKAQPTYTHLALRRLEESKYLHFVISQNIDGLHHRSGLPLDKLAELHGNVFSEECEVCHTQIIRPTTVGSFCRKRTGNVCNSMKGRNKSLSCRGKLRDTILDWEDALPETALKLSEEHCAKADLCLCLGTSLQIRPCRDLPRKTKKKGGKVVIVNLQKTSMDSVADLIIHERCDRVMKHILQKLNLDFENESNSNDLPKYAHVKKVILLSGRDQSRNDYIGEKLAASLPAALLRLNESLTVACDQTLTESSSDLNEAQRANMDADTTSLCGKLLEENDQLCASSPIWIINSIKDPKAMDFFQTYFHDRLLFVRIDASNDMPISELDSQSDTNIPWSFTFSNHQDGNVDEQIDRFVGLVNA